MRLLRSIVGGSVRRAAELAVACSVLAAALPALAGQALDDRVERTVSAGALRRANVGVHVVALGSGRVVYARNATRRFIVASNEKLVTAAAALETLGEGYEFVTAVYARGSMAKGVLRGDLVLRGGGDPTLGGRYEHENALDIFRRWAKVLKAKGLQRVTGDIVADDTFFDRVYRHPNWSEDQAWKWYYPSTSALSANDNCVTITVRPGPSAGAPALLSASPGSAPVELLNQCRTSSKGHSIWFDRKPGSNAITVGGLVRQGSAGYSQQVTVPSPPLYVARLFKEALEASGIGVDGGVRLAKREEGVLAARTEPLCIRRTSLVPVLRTMAKNSHNHYAEQVIKTVGAKASGTGSWEAGLSAAARMLRSMGLRDTEFALDDGSGLSRRDRLTPAALTTLLLKMRDSEHGATFVSLLPVAGEDGTLQKRLTARPYRGNVRAKTGYVSGVGALSGYARTRGGIEVAFSILINDTVNPPGTYSMRETLDSICRAIVDCAE